MQLTQEDLNEFKQIYQKEYGEEISDTEAREMGMRLLRLCKTLLEIATQSADE